MKQFIGGETAKRFFLDVKQKKPRGSFLFVGPPRVGKASFAKWLVGELHDSDKFDPDLFVLEGEGGIKIEQVRELSRFLNLKPQQFTPKVALIVDTERLSPPAANALLKTLEEPVGESLIILTASSPELLLPTIVSRCLIVRFGLVDRKTIQQELIKRGRGQKEAEEIAYLSHGRTGEALRLSQDEGALQVARENLQEIVRLIRGFPFERLSLLAQGLRSSELREKLALLLEASLVLAEAKTSTSQEWLPVPAEKLPLTSLIHLAALLEEALYYLGRNQNANLVLGNLLLSLEQKTID